MAVSLHGNNGLITTNGSAAAPSLAAPDTDTGLYFGTNLIHATTNGTTRLSIIADGKVGIGITNPGAELHAYHATSNTIAQFESGDAGAAAIWKDNSTYSSIEQNGTDFIISADQGASHANSALSFKVDTSEKLRIGSTGLISIGDNTNLDSQLTVTQTQGDCIRLRSVVTNNAFKYGIIKQEPYNNNAVGLHIIAGKSDSSYNEIAIGGGVDSGYAATQIDFYTGATTTTATGTRRLRITSDGDMGLGANNPGADPAIGNDATVFEIRQTTTGNITSGNNRKGAVLRLKHEAQWENGYQNSSPNDDLGRIEFVTGDSSVGEGVRSIIRTRNLQYYNHHALTFETAYGDSTTISERLRLVNDTASFGNDSPPGWQGGGGYYNIQLGNAGYFRSDTDASSNFLSYGLNAYRDSSGWKFVENGRATQISHGIGTDAISFYTSNSGNAGNAITFTKALNIASDGKVSVGTVQTTHLLSTIGGSSKQLLVQGTEADIWMTSTGGSSTTWRILGSTGGNTHRFRIYDHTNSREPFIITNDGNVGIYGATAGSFQTINSVAGSSVRGIEIHKDGTDTGTAIKLAGDAGNGSKQFSQLGFSGANLTAHWATYNTASTKIGEIMMGNTGMVGINPGSYAPLSSLDVRHHQGTAGAASGPSTVVTICAGRNSARGMEIKTGRPTSGNQNDAAVYYNTKDTESGNYHCQHNWQNGGVTAMTLGYTGFEKRLGVGTTAPNGRNGSIDISCDDTTTWSAYSDQRGEASLTLRNPSANTNTFTAMHFFSGGGTGSDITLAAVRKGNMEADFHVMRRINNAGSGNDNRPSVTMRGLGTGPRVIIWAEGDGDNNGDKQCGNHIFESQQQPGFNQYVYWNFKIGSASYSRAGSLRYHCTWSTGHASGSGYQIGTILWINNHSGGGTCDVREHLIYRRRYHGGHHYGWTSAPELEVFQNTNTGTNAGIVFRCQGHGSHNSNSYDMQTVVHLHIEHMSVAQNSITPRLERFGTSSVSGTGSAVSGARLGYCTFSDSAPVADSTDF